MDPSSKELLKQQHTLAFRGEILLSREDITAIMAVENNFE